METQTQKKMGDYIETGFSCLGCRFEDVGFFYSGIAEPLKVSHRTVQKRGNLWPLGGQNFGSPS